MTGDGLEEYEITIDARRFAGAWANAARVSFASEDFTVDFIRLDPRDLRGMVVSRVTLTPQFFRGVMDRMEVAWQDWLWRSMPQDGADQGDT